MTRIARPLLLTLLVFWAAAAHAQTAQVLVQPRRSVTYAFPSDPGPWSISYHACISGETCVLSGTVTVNIIWYNGASAWTTGQKAKVRDFINNLGTTNWIGIFKQYPNTSGSYVTGFTVGSECDNPETQGVSWAAPATMLNGIVTGSITACSMTTSATQVYIVLPSMNDQTSVSFSGDNQIEQLSGNHLHQLVAMHVSGGRLFSGGPTPTGDGAFDAQMQTLSHEIAEDVTSGGSTTGYQGPSAGAQIADPCENTDSVHFVTAGNGQIASFCTASSNCFLLTALWQPWTAINGLQAMTCNDIPSPAFSTFQRCFGASDCPASLNCVNNLCAEPTCSDSIQNQSESDVDCGAQCANTLNSTGLLCGTGKKCNSWEDCFSATTGHGENACSGGTCL